MMADTPAPTLSTHYYLENFHRLRLNVEEQYSDVLIAHERETLVSFQTLTFNAQCLYVRLISRTGPWFREAKLHYPEIGPVCGVIDELLTAGFVESAAGLSLEEAAGLFTYAELSRIFAGHLPEPVPSTRQYLLTHLHSLELSPQDILHAIFVTEADTQTASIKQRIVQPRHTQLIELLQLLFFGNRHQSVTDFVLQDLGVVTYYPYELSKSHRQFSCRDAVDEYRVCALLADEHQRLIEEDCIAALPSLAESVVATPCKHPSTTSRRHRLCNQLARDLERHSHLDLAATLYKISGRHPARERRARVLERLEKWGDAQALCLEILEDPWCEAEKDAAKKILPRIQRKLGAARIARKRDSFSELHLTLCPEYERVEILAAAALNKTWPSVCYVENHLFNALFGLAFWEQIFLPIPGAFNHPFQAVPMDMYDRDFCHRRSDAVERRLGELVEADLPNVLSSAYERYFSYQSHWVNWRCINIELVQAAAKIIPRSHLLEIWQRMLFDPRENRKGFPDLIALGENEGEYCLYEVKGPGDALQDSQKRWLRFFQQFKIPAQVAWVTFKE